MLNFLTSVNQILWGTGLLGLLLSMGLFCLVYHKFACLKSFRLLMKKNQIKNSASNHQLSPFQACMTSLAAAMGTGNIVGVATALTLGGAGAIFWMWIAALLGMGLIYAENVISCHYRIKNYSGAIAYLKYGLHSPKLAKIFAICCVGASFGMGNMTQSHAMAQSLLESFSIPPLWTGIITAILLSIIIFGGAKRIGAVTSILIPVLTGIYLVLAFIIIWNCRANLSNALQAIFQGAFGISAIGGGISGIAVRQAISVGIRRGVFSNEAGLGSNGLLHGEADSDNPEFLGLCGMLEVIADTFLCCTATALVILCTGALDTGYDGAILVLSAFKIGLGNIANWILPPMIALFAFCTLIGWSYCGASAFQTLSKHVKFYQGLFCIAVAIGAVMQLELVWTLADIANACMAYCNLPAILLLYSNFKKK